MSEVLRYISGGLLGWLSASRWALLACCVGAQASASAALLDDSTLGLSGGAAASEQPGFTRRLYIGIGGGVSRLDPRSRSDALTVSDEIDGGLHIYAGYDLTRWLSAEVYFADLGEAEIDFLGNLAGSVEYQVYGINAVAYLFNTRSGRGINSEPGEGLWRREGLSLYLSAGLGGLSNDSDILFFQDYGVHFNVGAGLEYGFSNGFAVRADISSYDTDIQYASISVLKRFGSVPAVTENVPQEPARTSAPAAEPTRATGPLSTGLFAFDSSGLTDDAKTTLDTLVAQERDTDSMMVINGYTDSVGSSDYNQALSERRAQAINDYLVAAGIAPSRMQTRGFGEQRPVSSNDTEQGRADNRRADVYAR